MNSRALGCLALAVGAFGALPPDAAHAYCRMTTQGGAQVGDSDCVERGEPLEWRNPCLSYAIDARGSQWMQYRDVEAAVDLAFEAWENVDCAEATTPRTGPPNLVFQALEPSTCRRAEFRCTGNVNTVAFLDPWEDVCAEEGENPSYPPAAFAVTVVWHNTETGEILDADLLVNDQQSGRFSAGGPYADCPETGCEGNDADLRSIVTHEVGHFIGIGHSNIEEATMFASAERAEVSKRTLAQDDIDAVCDIYPPGNLDQTCNATPRGGLELNCETDASGNELACSDATCDSSNGCSAGGSPGRAPWGAVLLALVALSAARRRQTRARRF